MKIPRPTRRTIITPPTAVSNCSLGGLWEPVACYDDSGQRRRLSTRHHHCEQLLVGWIEGATGAQGTARWQWGQNDNGGTAG
jgi:hypothetical protein